MSVSLSEQRRLEVQMAEALRQARREGAEAMREAAVAVAHKFRSRVTAEAIKSIELELTK